MLGKRELVKRFAPQQPPSRALALTSLLPWVTLHVMDEPAERVTQRGLAAPADQLASRWVLGLTSTQLVKPEYWPAPRRSWHWSHA